MNPKSFFMKRMSSLAVMLILLIYSKSNAQVINISSSEFIDVPAICHSNNSDINCIVTLPAYEYGKSYSFTIPILSGLDRTQATFSKSNENFQCDLAANNAVFTISSDGTLNLNMDSLCSIKIYNPPEITFNVTATYPELAPETYKFRIPIGRTPVKVSLVLDISGSMSLNTSEGVKRWDVLGKCVYLLSRELENFRIAGDSISISYFTHSIIQPPPPLSPNFNLITETSAATRISNLIEADISSRNPLYTTAMGQGLINGKNKLLLHQNPITNEIILLFTDGLQNVPPFILDDGISLSNGDSLNNSTDHIKYYTIATWGAGIVPEILDSIAMNNNGIALQSGNVTNFELIDFFYNQLQYMLYQGSPQIVESKKGILEYDEDTLSFPINKNISKASIIIPIHKNDTINVKDIYFEGITLPIQNFIEQTNDFIFIDIDFPVANIPGFPDDGQLIIVINGKTQKEYMATALVDDHYLTVDCSTDKSQYTVGDSILLTTQISYANKPLTNENKVIAYVFKPGDDINHLLATYEASDTTNYEDINSSVDKKFIDLLKNDTAFYQAILPNEQIVTLNYDGHGLYKGFFTQTELTGNYKILFVTSGKVKESSFKRSQTYTTILRFGQIVEESPETEIIKTTNPDVTNGKTTGRNIRITIRPKNKYGYFMGPGYKSKIKYNIQFKNSPLINNNKYQISQKNIPQEEPFVKEFKDHLDGRYSILLANVPQFSNPEISLWVRGEKLYEARLFQIPWWYYVLLIMIIIALFLIKRTKKNHSIKNIRTILRVLAVILIIIYFLHVMGFINIFFMI